MSQHTPGPWIAQQTAYEGHASGAWYILAPKGPDARSPSVAHVKQSTIQPMEANARLIAAAPAMLEALEDLVSLAEHAMRDANRDGGEYDIAEDLKAARAALRAAKGEA